MALLELTAFFNRVCFGFEVTGLDRIGNTVVKESLLVKAVAPQTVDLVRECRSFVA